MVKLTPILLVDEIEPCLEFWVDRLQFTSVLEVPDTDRLGFVLLKKGDVEIMYQSRSSIAREMPALADQPLHSSTLLYLQVENLDDVRDALDGLDMIAPPRARASGVQEIFVREPGGTLIAFTKLLSPTASALP